MSSRIALPDDGWVALKDPTLVSEKQRRAVRAAAIGMSQDITALRALERYAADVKAAKAAGTAEPDAPDVDITGVTEQQEQLADTLAVTLIATWSYEQPVTIDALQDLPGPVYDAIVAATTPLLTVLLPDFSPTASRDPENPTGGSAS